MCVEMTSLTGKRQLRMCAPERVGVLNFSELWLDEVRSKDLRGEKKINLGPERTIFVSLAA